MTNIIQFPNDKLQRRIQARDVINELVNATGCTDELTMLMVKLSEAVSVSVHKVTKFKEF